MKNWFTNFGGIYMPVGDSLEMGLVGIVLFVMIGVPIMIIGAILNYKPTPTYPPRDLNTDPYTDEELSWGEKSQDTGGGR